MIEMTPTPSMTDEEVEAWFAAAGLNASVVKRCSVAGCARCNDISLTRAA
jgi:hypothetical protein